MLDDRKRAAREETHHNSLDVSATPSHQLRKLCDLLMTERDPDRTRTLLRSPDAQRVTPESNPAVFCALLTNAGSDIREFAHTTLSRAESLKGALTPTLFIAAHQEPMSRVQASMREGISTLPSNRIQTMENAVERLRFNAHAKRMDLGLSSPRLPTTCELDQALTFLFLDSSQETRSEIAYFFNQSMRHLDPDTRTTLIASLGYILHPRENEEKYSTCTLLHLCESLSHDAATLLPLIRARMYSEDPFVSTTAALITLEFSPSDKDAFEILLNTLAYKNSLETPPPQFALDTHNGIVLPTAEQLRPSRLLPKSKHSRLAEQLDARFYDEFERLSESIQNQASAIERTAEEQLEKQIAKLADRLRTIAQWERNLIILKVGNRLDKIAEEPAHTLRESLLTILKDQKEEISTRKSVLPALSYTETGHRQIVSTLIATAYHTDNALNLRAQSLTTLGTLPLKDPALLEYALLACDSLSHREHDHPLVQNAAALTAKNLRFLQRAPIAWGLLIDEHGELTQRARAQIHSAFDLD